MAGHQVVVFKEYPFREGQKINIVEGRRRGDWLVIGVDERKVRLRCPVSSREVEWERFCYFVEDVEQEEWPSQMD